jgi:hypothetical protein
MEKNINKKKTPASPRKKSPGITRKEEKILLESNKIENSIVNETPIVYDTTHCTAPSASFLKKKPSKLSLIQRFTNFIKLLLNYK